jgi:glycosyltransferase involved in cell wall biosynthesis
VTLLGVRTQADIADLLVWADLLLLPSLSEGISNAALEAMASGLPVIATNSGGMREVIEDGRDGLMVPIGDIGAMTDRLLELAADREIGRRLGAAAAARAVKEFDLTRQIRVFDEAYRRLLSDPT